MTQELWRDVIGYEGLYSVSNLGRVRSEARLAAIGGGNVRTVKTRLLKPAKNPNGYLSVWLCKPGHQRSFLVHRLVADAFLPNPEGKPFVNHIDNNPSNNALDNLEHCSHQENMAHARRQGRLKIPPRLSPEKLAKIRELLIQNNLTRKEIAAMVGVSNHSILNYFGRSRPPRHSPETQKQIKELLDQQVPRKEIARRLNIPYPTVCDYSKGSADSRCIYAEKKSQIEKLLSKGDLSHREIARRVEVSPQTVGRYSRATPSNN